MRTLIFLAIIVYAAADSELYDLEKLDMNKLIENHDEFKSFIDCMIDRKECTKPFAPFRAVTAEAIEQNCRRCTPYQKHAFWLFLQGVLAKHPLDYDYFKHKYDPERKYFEKLEAELRKHSIEY